MRRYNCRIQIELFRFAIISLIILNNDSLVRANGIGSASILKNYNYSNKYHHRSDRGLSSSSQSKPCARDLKTLNSWNFRSLSTLQLSPPPAAATNVVANASVSPTRSRMRRRRRSRGNFYQNSGNDSDDVFANEMMNSRRQQKAVSNVDNDEEYQPSLSEMRDQLGPLGLLVANGVEVGIATAGSYMSGGIFGYMIGGAMGVPNLFRNGPSASADASNVLNSGGRKDFKRVIGDLNSKAFTQGKSWATLSASFSGFHALTRVCRGGKEDRWNSVISSACAGAYLSRQGETNFDILSAFSILKKKTPR